MGCQQAWGAGRLQVQPCTRTSRAACSWAAPHTRAPCPRVNGGCMHNPPTPSPRRTLPLAPAYRGILETEAHTKGKRLAQGSPRKSVAEPGSDQIPAQGPAGYTETPQTLCLHSGTSLWQVTPPAWAPRPQGQGEGCWLGHGKPELSKEGFVLQPLIQAHQGLRAETMGPRGQAAHRSPAQGGRGHRAAPQHHLVAKAGSRLPCLTAEPIKS